jgi:hypothetical protein
MTEDPAFWTLLRGVDTPMICNAVVVAQGRRGFTGFTHGTMQFWPPGPQRIVGFARTARVASASPPGRTR